MRGLRNGPADLTTRSAGLLLWQVGLPFGWWVLGSVLSRLLQFSRVESLVVVGLLFGVYDSAPGGCFLDKSSCIQIFTKTCGIH